MSFAAFSLFPLAASFVLSFTEWSPLRAADLKPVGLSNYARALSEPRFWGALKNTLVFVVGTIPVTTTAALFLALLVQRQLPARSWFRAAFFVPSIVSIVVIALIFKNFYAPYGSLNALLALAGIEGRSWLLDRGWALPAIMAMSVWASVGYYMLLYLAALEAIPESLYEAAAMDGAGFWGRLWHVTLPSLKPMTLFIVVINTIRSFQIFVEVFVMTQGGPLFATETVVLYLYEQAFHHFEMGYASAVAYLLFVIILLLSLLQMRWLSSDQRVHG